MVVVVVVVVVRTCVLMRCVWPYPITNAPNWGGRTPGSKLPASPPPWPSRPAGRRAKNASKNEATSPFQSVSNLSMNGSEPRPGTAGNLSLHEHSDVHNRAGTAPAAPPGNSELSGPSGTCRAQQWARQKPDQELHTFT